MNTPFQWTKQVASHFGGTRNPMIISWPARIKDHGGLRDQFIHTIDLVPTVYDVCGITAPTDLNGVKQKPIEGVTFAFTFDDANAKGLLYNIEEDFSQSNDLAEQFPEKLRQLQDQWWVEAAKYNVLPLDWRATIRMSAELMGRPSLIRGRTSMTYYPGTIGLPDAASPPMCNKSWTITADIEVPDGKAEGMIITHGGLEGGYGLYLKEGKPTFVYNFLSVERMTFAAKNPLPKGKTKPEVDFEYDGGGMGKGGRITMSANGKKIAEGRLERTIPIQFSLGEGIDVGMDVGSPIDFTYTLPFTFTGKINEVTVELGQLDIGKPEAAKADAGGRKRPARPSTAASRQSQVRL